MKNILYKYIMPPIGFMLIFFINITLKVRLINREAEDKLKNRGQNRIYSFWHGRLFYFPYLYRWQSQYSILVSPSIDGEIISRILNIFGFSTIRGSSYKSGREAFWRLADTIKNEKSVVIIGDGSRGPRYKLQKGIICLAKITGMPVVPMTFSAKNKKTFSTWDSFIIPYPFTRAVVIYGEPLYVQRDDTVEDKRMELETRLNDIMRKADNYYDD